VNSESTYEWRKQLMWGLVLVCVGVSFALDQMDLIDIDSLWHYWPLLLVVFGVNKIIGYPSAKHMSSGLWQIAVGLWMFAVLEGLFGMTWNNSWPFLVIACGVSMMLEPYFQRRFGPNEEPRNEK
jgi:hypothetical protein